MLSLFVSLCNRPAREIRPRPFQRKYGERSSVPYVVKARSLNVGEQVSIEFEFADECQNAARQLRVYSRRGNVPKLKISAPGNQLRMHRVC